jgi:hypothetical protein
MTNEPVIFPPKINKPLGYLQIAQNIPRSVIGFALVYWAWCLGCQVAELNTLQLAIVRNG